MIISMYAVERCTSLFSYVPACCCVVLLLLLQLLLITTAVSHFVPDGKFSAQTRGSLHLIPVFSFSSFKRVLFQCTPWQYLRIFSVNF